MDNILTTLLSWQFIVFGLGISAVLFVLKTIVEYVISYWTPAQESKLWKELFLPILPVVIGSVGAVALPSYSYPENIETVQARLVFGLVAGLFSGLIYRIIKALITQKLPSIADALPEDK